jgi:hypothetical protein
MLCVTNMLLHGLDDPSFVCHNNTLARPYISYGQADRVDIVLTNPPFGARKRTGSKATSLSTFRRVRQRNAGAFASMPISVGVHCVVAHCPIAWKLLDLTAPQLLPGGMWKLQAAKVPNGPTTDPAKNLSGNGVPSMSWAL